MHANDSFFKAAFSLFSSASLAVCAQAQPAYTEVISPTVTPGEGFGWGFGRLPDLTRDGVGEFYVVASRRVYVYDGEKLQPLYWVDSSCGGAIGYPTDSAGDVNGDGIPDLMLTETCADQVGQVVVVDGASGVELFRLNSPNPVSMGFFGYTLRLLPDMTGDGKEDWLIHERQSGPAGTATGQAYVFHSQTREAVRTIRSNQVPYSQFMGSVEIIPDVNGDSKPELLTTGSRRAIVRSLQTGQVLYELLKPDPDGAFGSARTGIGDINGDGIGDIATGNHGADNGAGSIYLFNGANGKWLRTLRSPHPQPNGKFGWRIESLPDLNGDGVPELWTQEDEFNLTYLFDGATSKLLKTIEYPGPLGPPFFISTVHQTAPPGIRAYLFASEFAGDSNEGRVYYMPFTPLPKPLQLKPLGASNTGFRFQVIGGAGSKVEVQGSGDFKTWNPVASVTLGNQATDVEDAAAANHSQRFYRAVQKE